MSQVGPSEGGRHWTADSVEELLRAPRKRRVRPPKAELTDERCRFREAAAVLAWFEPSTLRPAGPDHDGSGQSAIAHLLHDVMPYPLPEAPQAWMLRSDVRRDALKELTRSGRLDEAMTANPADVERPLPLQRLLTAYLRGERPGLEGQDDEDLKCHLQVVLWLDGVVEDLPDPDIIRRTVAERRLLAPFRALTVGDLHGRERDLKRLRDHVGVLASTRRAKTDRWIRARFRGMRKAPLLIHGMGGIGKSTLIAQFILEHAELTAERAIPFAHLDFDDPYLLAEEWRTWLQSALKQFRVQENALDRTAEESAAFAAAAEALEASLSGTAATDVVAIDGRAVQRFADLVRLLTGTEEEQDSGVPLLLVFDTFEEFQYAGEREIFTLSQFVALLQEAYPALRVVIAGRLTINADLYGDVDEHELKPLNRRASLQLLADRGVRDRRLADRIQRLVGGNPLSLRLAAGAIAQERDAEVVAQLEHPDSLSWATSEALIQGLLYRRLLEHIRDERARDIARAAVALRVVTPSVIAGVVMPVLRLEPDVGVAEELFEQLRHEASLMTPIASNSLRHRSDIRRVMLKLLAKDRQRELRAVDLAAVEYYAAMDGVPERAEELYHRLRLGQDRSVLDVRWIDAVAPLLRPALDELDPPEVQYLAARLGASVKPEILKRAAQEDWERHAAVAAGELLEIGRPTEALRHLRRRKTRRPGSPLSVLESWALLQLGRVGPAAELADAGLRDLQESGSRDDYVRMLALAAAVAEASGDAQVALRRLNEAVVVAEPGHDPLRVLRIHLHRLRLLRQAGDEAAAAAALRQLAERFVATPQEELRTDVDLARMIGAEIGSSDLVVLETALRIAGVGTMSSSQREQLAETLATNEPLFRREQTDPTGVLARTLGVEPELGGEPGSGPPEDVWRRIVDRAFELGRIDELLRRLLERAGGDGSIRASVAAAMEEPVATASGDVAELRQVLA